MARVQVQGTSPQVALTPQAAPTNTYYQPEQPQMSDAEYRAKLIEESLSKRVDPVLEKIADTTYKQQIETAKDEIAIASAADMSVFREQLEPELRGLSAEEVQAKVAERFQERYGDIENPYLSTALQKQAAMLAIDVSDKNRQEKIKADKLDFLGNVKRLVSDEVKKFDNKEIDEKTFYNNLEEIVKTSIWKKGDKSLIKPDGTTLIKSIAEVGLLNPNSDAILGYLDFTGHSKSSSGAYETELRMLQNNRIKNQGEVYQVGIFRELSDLAATGAITKVRQRIDQLIPEFQKRGLSVSGLNTFDTQARTAANKQRNIALQTAAENRSAAMFMTTGVLGDETWTDADGKVHNVSSNAVKRKALALAKQSGGMFEQTVLSNVQDPEVAGTIRVGINALFNYDTADVNAKKQAEELVKAATATYDRLKDMPPSVMLKQIPNESDREMLRMVSMMSATGESTTEIARAANKLKVGKAPAASPKVLDAMVKEVVSNASPWWSAIPFMGVNATISPEIRESLGYYYMMAASRNASPEDAAKEAVERFSAEHEFMKFDGGINFIYNKNDTQLAASILGKATSNPKAVLELIPDAAQQAMANIKKQYPNSNPKNKPVMIMKDYFRPNRLILTYETGEGVTGSTVINPSDIPELARQWRNKDRGKSTADSSQSELFNSP